jgi:hypothetical protein
MLLTG